MAYTNTPSIGQLAPSHIDTKETVEAINQRRTVIGQAGLAVPALNDVAAYWTFWRSLQDAVLGLRPIYVASHEADGTLRPRTWWDDKVDGPAAWASNTDLLTTCGMAQGFRRLTVHELPGNWQQYNDPKFTYGLCQRGDIVGPWLLDDLRKVLSRLIYTTAAVSWARPVVNGQAVMNIRMSPERHGPTWAGTKTAAEAWNAFGFGQAPYAYSMGEWEGWFNEGTQQWDFTSYEAFIIKCTSVPKVTINAAVASDTVCYLKPTVSDGGGNGTWQNADSGKWQTWDVVKNCAGGGGQVTHEWAACGMDTAANVYPAWCDQPQQPPNDRKYKGWQLADQIALVDWSAGFSI